MINDHHWSKNSNLYPTLSTILKSKYWWFFFIQKYFRDVKCFDLKPCRLPQSCFLAWNPAQASKIIVATLLPVSHHLSWETLHLWKSWTSVTIVLPNFPYPCSPFKGRTCWWNRAFISQAPDSWLVQQLLDWAAKWDWRSEWACSTTTGQQPAFKCLSSSETFASSWGIEVSSCTIFQWKMNVSLRRWTSAVIY